MGVDVVLRGGSAQHHRGILGNAGASLQRNGAEEGGIFLGGEAIARIHPAVRMLIRAIVLKGLCQQPVPSTQGHHLQVIKPLGSRHGLCPQADGACGDANVTVIHSGELIGSWLQQPIRPQLHPNAGLVGSCVILHVLHLNAEAVPPTGGGNGQRCRVGHRLCEGLHPLRVGRESELGLITPVHIQPIILVNLFGMAAEESDAHGTACFDRVKLARVSVVRPGQHVLALGLVVGINVF